MKNLLAAKVVAKNVVFLYFRSMRNTYLFVYFESKHIHMSILQTEQKKTQWKFHVFVTHTSSRDFRRHRCQNSVSEEYLQLFMHVYSSVSELLNVI